MTCFPSPSSGLIIARGRCLSGRAVRASSCMSRACRLRHRNALFEKAWEVLPTAFSGIFGLKLSLSILSNHPMISGQKQIRGHARATERRYNFTANQLLVAAKRLETVQRKKSCGQGRSPWSYSLDQR